MWDGQWFVDALINRESIGIRVMPALTCSTFYGNTMARFDSGGSSFL